MTNIPQEGSFGEVDHPDSVAVDSSQADPIAEIQQFVRAYSSGPLPELQESFDQRLRRDIETLIPVTYLTQTQTYPAIANQIIYSDMRLQGALKITTGPMVFPTSLLQFLLTRECTWQFPEHYSAYVLLLFLKHPRATREVYDAVFSYSLSKRSQPELLGELLQLGKFFNYEIVQSFQKLFLCKDGALHGRYVQLHAQEVCRMLEVGEWERSDVERLLALPDLDPTTAEEFKAAYSANVTGERLGLTKLSETRNFTKRCQFVRQYVEQLGEALPFTFLIQMLETGSYDNEILHMIPSGRMLPALRQFCQYDAALRREFCEQAWDYCFPWVCQVGTAEDIQYFYGRFLVGAPLSPSVMQFMVSSFPKVLPTIGVQLLRNHCVDLHMAFRLIKEARSQGELYWQLLLTLLDLPIIGFESGLELLQRVSTQMPSPYVEEFVQGFWKRFSSDTFEYYCSEPTHPLRSLVLTYFYKELFEAGLVTTFVQLQELYHVLPMFPDKEFELLTMFIRPTVDSSVLQLIADQGCQNFSGPQRLQLIQKINTIIY